MALVGLNFRHLRKNLSFFFLADKVFKMAVNSELGYFKTSVRENKLIQWNLWIADTYGS